jgi:hypothetical protein
MTPLRAKMITDMQLHRLAPGTQALYLREVASFATFYGRSPEHLTSDRDSYLSPSPLGRTPVGLEYM